MALCPFARHRLISPGSNDPRINARMAILHVDAGNNSSLHGYFNGPSGGIESHFFVKKNGKIEQYRDTNYQADANLNANGFAVSIETQGYGGGKWTRRQLKSIKRLLVWLNDAEGIPLHEATGPYGSGVGYHVQFGAPGAWTPVAKSCPGPKRIKQYENDIVPWMNGNPRHRKDWFDMANENDLRKVLREENEVEVPSNVGTKKSRRKNPTWLLPNAVSHMWWLARMAVDVGNQNAKDIAQLRAEFEASQQVEVPSNVGTAKSRKKNPNWKQPNAVSHIWWKAGRALDVANDNAERLDKLEG